ncbi:MAG: hypothetical protein OZ933_16210 [Chloroflexota bacterium]|nr:MAG: hypothetical protein UZ13_02668 [Chloroflexi bacterium OLB13]MEB2367621.1 hypothetical protein [Chloroflexota bacterium]
MSDISLIVALALILTVIGVVAYEWDQRRRTPGRIKFNAPFIVRFANGQWSRAVYVPYDADPHHVQSQLKLPADQRTIFAIGGAGGMSTEDIRRCQALIDGVCMFASAHEMVVITGGTEGGIMQMFGDSRQRLRLKLRLVGIAPLSRVRFPGRDNPNADADLEDSHSDFVLVEGAMWGVESDLLQELALCVAGYDKRKVAGILINGGSIALNEVAMAAERGLTMFVVEGSGRTADAVATAIRTKTAEQALLKMVVEGGRVEFIQTTEGIETVQAKLDAHFRAR